MNNSSVPAPFRVWAKTTTRFNPLRWASVKPAKFSAIVCFVPSATIGASTALPPPSILNKYVWPATPINSNVAVVLVPSNASNLSCTLFVHHASVVPE